MPKGQDGGQNGQRPPDGHEPLYGPGAVGERPGEHHQDEQAPRQTPPGEHGPDNPGKPWRQRKAAPCDSCHRHGNNNRTHVERNRLSLQPFATGQHK